MYVSSIPDRNYSFEKVLSSGAIILRVAITNVGQVAIG